MVGRGESPKALAEGRLTARIDLSEGDGTVSVRVAGRLDGEAARLLLELCRPRTGRLSVNVEDLVSIERASVETLQDLRAAGARIVGATPYIAMLLNMGANGPSADGEEEE
jgi:hypothetical protein